MGFLGFLKGKKEKDWIPESFEPTAEAALALKRELESQGYEVRIQKLKDFEWDLSRMDEPTEYTGGFYWSVDKREKEW
jgi:hypothetical protein